MFLVVFLADNGLCHLSVLCHENVETVSHLLVDIHHLLVVRLVLPRSFPMLIAFPYRIRSQAEHQSAETALVLSAHPCMVVEHESAVGCGWNLQGFKSCGKGEGLLLQWSHMIIVGPR